MDLYLKTKSLKRTISQLNLINLTQFSCEVKTLTGSAIELVIISYKLWEIENTVFTEYL